MNAEGKVYVGCMPCGVGTYVSSLDAAHHWTEQHWRVCKRTKDFGALRSVTPKEKYAQLEAAGEQRPVCDCHGEPLVWKREEDYKAGGRWVHPYKWSPAAPERGGSAQERDEPPEAGGSTP